MLHNMNIEVLMVMAGIGLLLAICIQGVVAYRRSVLVTLTIDRPEPETDIYPAGAIPLRMDPELIWARYDERPYALVVMTMRGRSLDQAIQALGRSLRGEENAYRLTDNRVAVGLWNCDERGMLGAIERLAKPMMDAGDVVIEAGGAIFPRDADTSLELIQVARSRQQPVDQVRDAWKWGASEPPRTMTRRSLRLVMRMVPGLIVSAAAIAVTWAGIGQFVHGGSAGAGVKYAVCAGIGVVLAAVLWFAWNVGVRGEPRSRGMERPLRRRIVGLVALLMGGLMAWSVAAPTSPTWLLPYAGVLAISMAALLLPIMHGRHLARAEQPLVPLLCAVAGIALVLMTYNGAPDVAIVGRIIAAVGIGAVVARLVDQLAWVILICGGITIVDTWSLLSSDGVTKKLFESDPHHITDRVLLPLPDVHGTPIAWLGSVDLVFAAIFMSVAHLWRLSVARTIIALWLSMSVAVVVPQVTSIGTPMLPFMAVAFLIAHARPLLRSLRFGRPSADQFVDADAA